MVWLQSQLLVLGLRLEFDNVERILCTSRVKILIFFTTKIVNSILVGMKVRASVERRGSKVVTSLSKVPDYS